MADRAVQDLQEGLERARNLERPLFEGEREAGNMLETRDVRGARAVEYLPRRASGGFQVSSVSASRSHVPSAWSLQQ